jgi:hypothetical protein
MIKKHFVISCICSFHMAYASHVPSIASKLVAANNPENVSIFPTDKLWNVGFTALSLKPAASLLNPYWTSPDGSRYTLAKSPSSFGFALEGAYLYGLGNDINLNWLHFDQNSTNSFIGGIDFLPGFAFQTNMNFKTNFNAINFESAQNGQFNNRTRFRFHGGLHYVTTDVTQSIINNEISNQVQLIENSYLNAQYNGIGPRVGLDLSYDLTKKDAHKGLTHIGHKSSKHLPERDCDFEASKGLRVYGKSALALLAGHSKTHFSGVNRSSGVDWNYIATKSAIIPEIEAKLGLQYWYNWYYAQFKLDAGWMFQYYFNILDTTSVDQQTIFYVAQQSSSVNSSLSLHGPFIKGSMEW